MLSESNVNEEFLVNLFRVEVFKSPYDPTGVLISFIPEYLLKKFDRYKIFCAEKRIIELLQEIGFNQDQYINELSTPENFERIRQDLKNRIYNYNYIHGDEAFEREVIHSLF